jgi:hypothetical protein
LHVFCAVLTWSRVWFVRSTVDSVNANLISWRHSFNAA